MKQPIRLLRQFKALFFLLFVMHCSFNAFSINIPAINISVNLRPGNNFSSVRAINCDMIDIPGNGKLTAVVYDAYNVTMSRQELVLVVEFNGTPAFSNTDVIWHSLMSSTATPYANPDVAIIDMSSGTWGEDYRIMVVAENLNTNAVDLLDAQIIGVGAVPPTYTPASPLLTTLNTNLASTAYNPHIDAAADKTFLIGGNYYGSDDFVVVWEEPTGILPGIWARPFNYQATFTPGTPAQIFSGFAGMADVACRGYNTLSPLVPSPTYSAYISFVDATSGLMNVGELISDKSATVYSAGGAMPMGPVTPPMTYGYPRIEARKLGDVIPGAPTWELVADADPGSGFAEIHAYNDIVFGPTIMSLGSASNHFKPVVSGVGWDINATGVVTFGAKKFTVSYYTDDAAAFGNANGDYVSNFIDMSGGGLLTPDYYQVATNPIRQIFTSKEPCIAISTSSNNGDDLLTVFYDGWDGTDGEIRYKFMNGNTINYKNGTTGVSNLIGEKIFSISPNPATDNIKVGGVTNASYSITDITGKTVASGTVTTSTNSIAINQLAAGTYLILFTENGSRQQMKFVKQ